MYKKLFKGFTLAEVLIALGVIGVVSAIPLPNLIKNYQKRVTVERLKSTYSLLHQAVRMSEIDNGPVSGWDFPDESNAYEHGKEFSEVYIKPYLKNLKTYKSNNNHYIMQLNNGVDVQVWPRTNYAEINIFLNGAKSSKAGKTAFYMVLSKIAINNTWHGKYDKAGLYFYGQGLNRNYLMYNTDHCACANTTTPYPKMFCGAVIMGDGWKIEKDYPW